MKLRVTRQAHRHLEAIAEYLTERNPAAARRVGRRIREMIKLLAAVPLMGHGGALPGTREMGVPGLPYIIVHRIDPADGGTLVILGVYHAAQLRPGLEKK